MKKILIIGLIAINSYSQDVVTVSVYNAVAEQCNADYLNTAFMYKLDSVNHFKERIIAVSRDLLHKYPNKSKVRLKGTMYDGIYTVRDKMSKRSKYRGAIVNSVDILIDKNMPIGLWKNATISLVK